MGLGSAFGLPFVVVTRWRFIVYFSFLSIKNLLQATATCFASPSILSRLPARRFVMRIEWLLLAIGYLPLRLTNVGDPGIGDVVKHALLIHDHEHVDSDKCLARIDDRDSKAICRGDHETRETVLVQ
jgi:hypothetical protein